MGVSVPNQINLGQLRKQAYEAYLIEQKESFEPGQDVVTRQIDEKALEAWRNTITPSLILELISRAEQPLIPYTPEQIQVVTQLEQFAERILSTQDIQYGSVAMYNSPEGKHAIPALHVAAVLHGLADFTHNKHIVSTIIDQQALARDERGQGFEPRVTSLGRYFHRLADIIEWREMDKWQK